MSEDDYEDSELDRIARREGAVSVILARPTIQGLLRRLADFGLDVLATVRDGLGVALAKLEAALISLEPHILEILEDLVVKILTGVIEAELAKLSQPGK